MNYYNPPEHKPVPCCPICGSTNYDTIYKGEDDNVCGCNECIRSFDAEDWWDELDEASQPDPDREYDSRFD